MGGCRYVRIVGERSGDGDLFNRLMSLPETLEVHIEEETQNYVATVESEAVSGREQAEDFFRKIRGLKGVRKVAFHRMST